jgi:hypothetical protein
MVPEYVEGPPGDEMRLVVNLKTAKAMVLTLPSGGRPRPNELIEQSWRCPLLAQSGHSRATDHVRFWG